ncbi:PREDICTED: THAP domain-containing protein 2-like [Vollenhovia emeryi]|uniref:THAP domain-containing protein 2-like n=1 Tax=Vollenhovia emeryi TaxID=411798 RepID=UPI0005F55DFA|nr:PREDICTED: THAP domain-containing protein 2-like [Vollenhovia emeryi]
MPSRCSAPRCTNSNNEGYCCVRFPENNELKRKWIDAAGIPDWNPPKSAVLCEVHFDQSALYCVGNKKLINKNVLPNFFCKCDMIHNKKYRVIKQKKNSTMTMKNAISDHNYFLRSLCQTDCENYQIKLRRRKSLRQFIHDKNCCVVKKSVNIKMLKKLVTKGVPVKEENSLNMKFLQDYKGMQMKLNNIIQENKVLRERVHRLQDDFMHIKSFGFYVKH